MMTAEAKPTPQKKETVNEFTELINEYPVVGVANLENLPAKQLMDIRSQLRDQALVKMTKKRLIKRAFDKSEKEGIEDLGDHMRGMPALVFTEENPFSLYKELQQSKSPAPIKGGQIAPKDIQVEEGPTSFSPGPIIGELGSLGIDAGIDGGKVTVQETTTVAEEGEEVSEQLASILTRLEIYPMEIGLNITAVYEDGAVIQRNTLDIDVGAYKQKLQTAQTTAQRLSIGAAIHTEETIQMMIQQSHADAFKLAFAQDIINEETIKNVLGEAQADALALDKTVSD